MSYHDLSECTLTPDERWEEAARILRMLAEPSYDSCTEAETKFIRDLSRGGTCTVKQLFWLRDIKDKYL